VRERVPRRADALRLLREVVRFLGVTDLKPPPPPPEEVRLHGRVHSKRRDAQAISHHYDVSNDFYRLLLGPSLTYSCACFDDPADSLEAAQSRKHELVAGKLGLRPGMRLLDVGCGWGSMVLHAAAHHGVQAVGVTLSEQQATLARQRVAEAGLGDRVEIRVQDYRDVRDGPFDAISSIGMFEHVGLSKLQEYFTTLHGLLATSGRLLNHGIACTPVPWYARYVPQALKGHTFLQRYVFPDGELHEVGTVVSAMQAAGFEARHAENLREHYALTIGHWLANLESRWDEAAALTSEGRARVWRLYLAGSQYAFQEGHIQLVQVLATRSDQGRSGMPLRPDWDAVIADPPGLLTTG
jgi:cyclopropane-fatty-acyl-phospholipid synthase